MSTHEQYSGVVPYDGARAQQGYRLNRLGSSLTDPAKRAAFLADEVGTMRALGLDAREIALVQARDWRGLIAAGGNIYVMLKIAGALGVHLGKMGAQMRGISYEDFTAMLAKQRERS